MTAADVTLNTKHFLIASVFLSRGFATWKGVRILDFGIQ